VATKKAKKTKKAAKKQVDVTEAKALEHGLSPDDFALIQERLERLPTSIELAVFGVMWSEQHALKSTRSHLAKLPKTGHYVMDGPVENSGVIDVGDDWAVVVGMNAYAPESFLEPKEGEATGVAGLLGDVAAVGVHPLASLNSLRFGGATQHKTRKLASSVVAGIAGYANSGVPALGGEIYFDEC